MHQQNIPSLLVYTKFKTETNLKEYPLGFLQVVPKKILDVLPTPEKI